MSKSDWQFVLTPDEMGLCRVIVDGKYYGIPLSVAQYLSAIKQQEPVAIVRTHDPADEREGIWLEWRVERKLLISGTKLYPYPAPIPEGWQPVPKEPTKQMIRAGERSHWLVKLARDEYELAADTVYKAMLNAAPKPGDKP